MKMKELPTQYDHKATEKRLQDHWVKSGTYRWKNDAPRVDTYVIDTPPPTVSGLLHMGHVFSYTQCDFIARYQRMRGKDVFYPMGFDDNGLPTERLVEKTRKKRASDYESREAFIKVCEEVSEEARREFRELFQAIALSVDWNQEYHTISESSRRLSQHSFLDLHQKGHVERRMEPMLWDPIDQTAIAQAEIVDKELDSHFSDIYFGIDGSDEKITIATTRPELIPACVAIFHHPEDERYRHLKGKQAVTALFGVKVPILEDDTVEMDKGTGIMMCCTFGDEADIDKWRKHRLPMRLVVNKYGKMDFSSLRGGSETTDAVISGDCFADTRNDILAKLEGKKLSNPDKNHPGARQIMLQMLQDSGDLIESRPIKHMVKCAERSGAPLEIIPTPQWFVKVTDKKDALKACAAESIWHPEWMRLRMDQWIDGLSWDWCISRQRYYGVPFPVWYVHKGRKADSNHIYEDGHIASSNNEIFDKNAEIIFPEISSLPINPLSTFPYHRFPESDYSIAGSGKLWKVKNKNDDNDFYLVEADADVMDTWATSSISPQINAGALFSSSSRARPQADEGSHKTPPVSSDTARNDERYHKLFPADLRPQAHEIIRTWAFYTVVKSHLHAQTAPWKNLMISGWCLAEDKTKMSKSKGNVVTPVDLIEQHGTDAVRYWAATSRLGQDTAFSTDLLKIGKKLVTKLWNATKFAALHLEKLRETPQTATHDIDKEFITSTLDLWILTRLHRCIEKSTAAFDAYEYADALRAIEDFFWNDFCDNYLELVKTRVYAAELAEHPNVPAASLYEAMASAAEEREDVVHLLRAQRSAVHTIHYCLEAILKLFAPIVPHITEELYSHIFADQYATNGSLHARHQWPEPAHYPLDEKAEASGIAAVAILAAIRGAKSDRGVSIKYPIVQLLIDAAQEHKALLTPAILDDLKGAGNIGNIRLSSEKLSSVEGSDTTTLSTEDTRFTLALTFARAVEDVA